MVGSVVVAALLGFATWTFVEYLVHGILSHRFRTFVTPLHAGHHREPRNVFTSVLAWGPLALLFLAVASWVAGVLLGAVYAAALLAGFLHYEWFHWRIHFRRPRTARQRRLRAHHLAHHLRRSRAYHGVTTRFWDRVFGTLDPHWRDDYARVADHPPLQGESNLRAAWDPRAGWALLRSVR